MRLRHNGASNFLKALSELAQHTLKHSLNTKAYFYFMTSKPDKDPKNKMNK